MMRVGIIAPIKFLEKYCITNIQYCLPALVVENQTYRNFYCKRRIQGNTIILDCKKPGWKREPEDINIVKKAIEILEPDLVIAPSCMFRPKESEEIYKWFRKVIKARNVVRCIEGTSEKEVGKYVEEGNFTAIPSYMFKYALKRRWVNNIIFIENHLSIDELKGYQGLLVTSLPIRLGLQGRVLSDYLPSPPSLTFYETEDKYPMVTRKNVEETLEYYEM